MRVIECAYWDEFVAAIRILPDNTRTRIFRGHSEIQWPLASIWERFLLLKKAHNDQVPVARLADEKLQCFREAAVGLPNVKRSELQGDFEWWALGRHHGLVTPLLDWTRSPYVAAFFAWMDYHDRRNPGLASWGAAPMTWGDDAIAIWALADPEGLTIPGEFDLFASRSEHAWRQKAQQGVFTILAHPDHFDVEAYLASRGLVDRLTKYVVPGHQFRPALTDLRLMNVSYATLFPDLDGAARYANVEAIFKLSEAIVGLMGRNHLERFEST